MSEVIRMRALLPFAALAVALGVGCSGNNGAPGQAGTSGNSCSVVAVDAGAVVSCTDGTSVTIPKGMNGASAPDGGSCTVTKNADAGTYTLDCGGDAGAVTLVPTVVDYATMTADEIADAQMTATITNVSFPGDGRPVISIKATERHGYGVKDLSTTAVSWRFSLLKLVPGIVTTTGGVNGSASDTWVSYIAPNDHTAASSETAAAANLTDHGDGTYDYKLAQVINGGPTTAGTTYDPAATHRLIVLLYASGNPFPPINLVKDSGPLDWRRRDWPEREGRRQRLPRVPHLLPRNPGWHGCVRLGRVS